MTKRQIRSIYHWSIMGLVMGLPLLLTATSYIPNAYNDNNVIDYVTQDYVKDNLTLNKYNKLVFEDYTFSNNASLQGTLIDAHLSLVNGGIEVNYDGSTSYIYCSSSVLHIYDSISHLEYINPTGYVIFDVSSSNDYDYFSNYSYVLTDVTQHVINNGAYQVHAFNEWFINQPLNTWYKEIMTLTFGLSTSYSPLNNVMYFPLYAVWVLIFDLLYDVIALVPCIFHNILDKLKGEKE